MLDELLRFRMIPSPRPESVRAHRILMARNLGAHRRTAWAEPRGWPGIRLRHRSGKDVYIVHGAHALREHRHTRAPRRRNVSYRRTFIKRSYISSRTIDPQLNSKSMLLSMG